MKDLEVRVLAIRPTLEVLIAKHNNSQYFIADGEDITEIVSEVVGTDDWSVLNETRVLDMAYKIFLTRNNRRDIQIPMFELNILDSAKTNIEVLMATFIDIWHHTPEKALAVCYEVDEVGVATLGTYTFEIASCFARMIDMVCEQLDHEIKYRIDPVDSVLKSMSTLDTILSKK